MMADTERNWCHPGNFKPGALEDPRNCTDILDADDAPPSGFFKKIFGQWGIEDELNKAKKKMAWHPTGARPKYDDDMEELRSKCINEKDKIFCGIINDLPDSTVTTALRAIFYLIEEILYEEYRNQHLTFDTKKISLENIQKIQREVQFVWQNIKLIFQKKVLVNPEETMREIFTKARNSWLSRECLNRCEGRTPTKACLKRCGIRKLGKAKTKACLKRCEHALVRPPTIDEGDVLNNPSSISITDEDGGREPIWVEQRQGYGKSRICRYLNLENRLQSQMPKTAAPNAPTVNKCVLEHWYNDLLEAAAQENEEHAANFLHILRSPDDPRLPGLTRILLKIIHAPLDASLQPDDGSGTGLRYPQRTHRARAQAQKFQKAEAAIKKLDNLREKYIPHSLRPDTFAGGPEARQRKRTALLALSASAGVRDAAQKMYNPPPPPRLDAVERRRSFGSWLPPPTPLALFKDAPTPANAALLLGVQPNASKKEISRAFRKCSLQNHSDKGGSDSAQIEQCNAPRDILLWKGGHRVRMEKRKKTRRNKKKKRKKTRRHKKNKRKKTKRHKKKKRKKKKIRKKKNF